jgi:flagellar hook-length control protein FliK
MQFNVNIDRYSSALPPIEPSPSGAAVDRSRERESFDRHLEEARRRPADADRRPAADDAARSSTDEAASKPKAPPPKPHAEETSAEKRSDPPARDGSEAKEPGNQNSHDQRSKSSPTDPTEDETKPTKKNLDKHKSGKGEDPSAKQHSMVAVAQNTEIAKQADAKASEQSGSDEVPVLPEPPAGNGAAAKPARNAKSVAAGATVDLETAPADTQRAGDKANLSTAAAGAEAAIAVAPAASEVASPEAGPVDASKTAPLPAASIAATDAATTTGARNAATGKKGGKTAPASGAEVKDAAAAEPSDAAPGPRRPRIAKSFDSQRHLANDALPQNTDLLASPADKPPVELVAATQDQPIREPASQAPDRPTDRLVDRVVDQVGPRDAPSAPAAHSPANGNSTDAPLNPTEKLASTLSSRIASGGTEKGSTATDVERIRFVQRVAKAFQSAADRGGPVRLRLSPPELGALRLEITLRNGGMTARLEAETPAAKTLLLDGLPALRERLAQQDIKVDRFDVDLMGQSPNDSPQTRDGAANSQGQATAPPRKRIAAAAVAAPSMPTAATPGRGDGRLNVLI